MRLSFRKFECPARLLSFGVAASALLGSYAATAQTAPQLLPYTVTAVAGGGTAAIAAGAACPVSGLSSTDAYGDGCLATEVQLVAPRYAVADQNGNVFFGDFTNGLIRRVDVQTGIVTAVAGGAASSPAVGAACGTTVSTSSRGDGCLGTAVKLGKPVGLAFASNGDLYFADNGSDTVRKVAATNGVITDTGVITTVVGNSSNTFGYNVNNASTTGPIIAATNGYTNFPYGIAFDKSGNLYISDEGSQAVEVVNLGTTTQTIMGQSVPAGSIAKIVGYGNGNTKVTTGECPNFTAAATGSRGGCYFAKFTDGAQAVVSAMDNPYSVAVDGSGNLYIANEFNQNVPRISTDGIIHTFVGDQGAGKKVVATTRGVAGTFNVGSQFGVAADALNNVYFTDALNGYIWRVDGAGKYMYVVGGGAATACSAAKDTYGDGCPATQATFGSSGTTFATAASPGIFGIAVDQYSNLYVGDSISNLVRKVSSGTQFGPVGVTPVTQTVAIHFAAGDSAASNAYTITSGSANFSVGTATCTSNSDTTVDCTLPLTATGTTLGAFSGTLQVKSVQGATGSFPLSGIYVNSPQTRTTVSVTNPAGTCSGGGSTYSTSTSLVLTATVVSTGSPAGTVTFFANGNQIGTPQAVSNSVATLTTTLSNAGTYTITATYSGDSYFKTSTGRASSAVTTTPPTFTAVATPYTESSVTAGGTALYSFTLTQSVFAGSITFSCTGLPAYAACVFNPPTVSATGCSATNTVAMSITTQQPTPVRQSTFGFGGRWTAFTLLPGFALALLIGLRRRRTAMRFGQVWMGLALLLAASGLMACGNGTKSIPGTPAGTSTVTVTATGSNGTVSSFTVPLTVK